MKIIITEEQYKNIISEYINNDMVTLMKYFSQTDEEKKKSLPYSYYYFINDFMEDEDQYYDFEIPKISSYTDSDGNDIEEEMQGYELIEWLQENNVDLYNKYSNWLFEKIKYNELNISPEDYPAWSYYDSNPILIKNQWLIHFTNDAEGIAKNGFKYGVDEIDKLGLTTYLGDFEKKYGGYNFAYLLRDFNSYGKAGIGSRGGKYKYGKEAVIFRASGIKLYHYGDEEPQVIFYGNTAKNIIPITTGENADWAIYNTKTGGKLVEFDDLEKLVRWVETNYPQYSKKLHESVLTESVSDVVFHFTYAHNLLNILKTNKINLSPSYGVEADNALNYNKLFSLSLTTARNSATGYHSSGKNPENAKGKVRLQMNGRELNYNYKSKHVDYWQYPRTKSFTQSGTSYDEMEERIVTDKNEIKPANRYITLIEIYINEEDINRYKQIKEYADKLNIPCYFYTNGKDFNFSIKKNAVDINTYQNNPEGEFNLNRTQEEQKQHDIRDIVKLGALLIYKDDNLKNKLFQYAKQNNYDIQKLEKLLTDRINTMNDSYMRYPDSYLTRELELVIGAELSGSRQSKNELLRYVIKILGYDMKKRKFENIKEYINYKMYIGKKTQQQFNKELYQKSVNIIDSKFNEVLQNLNNYSFYDTNGNYHQNNVINIVPELKNQLTNIITKIKNYYKEKIMSNDDMFKYTFYYHYGEVKDKLNINKINYQLASDYIDYENSTLGEYEIKNVILYTLYEVSDFIDKEIPNIQEEYRQQYNY